MSSSDLFFPVPKSMNAFMTLSKTVLKQGEALMVNCTVEEAEIVYFEWDFPRKEVSGQYVTYITKHNHLFC